MLKLVIEQKKEGKKKNMIVAKKGQKKYLPADVLFDLFNS